MRTYENFVERFGKVYFEDIKPLINETPFAYPVAGALLRNVAKLVDNDKDIFNSQDARAFSSGLGLLASIEMMSEKLRDGTFDPEKDFKTLESYLKQVNLPTEL
jgi:hypothetical protein